jgi:hypothetical protein
LQVTRGYRKPNDFALPKHTVARQSLDVSRKFEKAEFEKTLRKRLEFFKAHKHNGLLLKTSSLGFLFFCKECSDRAVVVTGGNRLSNDTDTGTSEHKVRHFFFENRAPSGRPFFVPCCGAPLWRRA